MPYASFLAYAAIRLHDGEASDFEGGANIDQNAEVIDAFHQFTRGQDRPITIADLKRVARDIREDISDDVLKDMLVEANGGSRKDGWKQGVQLEDFEVVMKRAGVF